MAEHFAILLAGERRTAPTILAGERRTALTLLEGEAISGKLYLHDGDGNLFLDGDGLPVELM